MARITAVSFDADGVRVVTGRRARTGFIVERLLQLATNELEIVKSMDAAYDGTADAGLGQMRAATAVTVSAALTAANTRENRLVTAATLSNNTTAGAATDWATTHLAAVWLFDRTF